MGRKGILRGLFSFLVTVMVLFIVSATLLFSLPSVSVYAEKLALFSAVQTLQGNPAVLLSKSTDPAVPPVSQSSISESSSDSSSSTPDDEPYVEETIGSDVIEQDLSVKAEGGKIYSIGTGFLRNYSTLSKEDILATIHAEPPFKTVATGEPQVLIIHTHTTESYYGSNENFRTTDKAQNMVAVGDEIVKELEKKGIGVIHDTEFYDYPSYNGGYARSAETIKRVLAEHPTIKIVLDVHRDALGSGNSKTAPTAVVDGNKVAQILIVSNCTNDKNNLPNFKSNLNFAARLENKLETIAPGITRPLLFSYRDYNQALAPGCILTEIGGHANTLQQAKWAGKYLGRALADVVLDLQK